MSDTISGFWVALPTPLNSDGDIDNAVLARHARWLLEQGCDGVVPFGTTGEGTSFSAAERLAATEALLASGIQPAQIGLGAGCPAIQDSVALTRSALALGLQHVLLLPPYFYRDVDAAGIEDAFAAILDGVADERLRVTLYHIPQVSGVPVPAVAVARLRARYGRMVAGVKDSSGNFAHFEAFRAAAPDVAIAIGNEVDINRALQAGGVGTICGMANLAPGLVRAMFDSQAAAGPMREAVGLITGPFVPTLKAGLAALTGEAAWSRVRPPLRAVDAGEGRRVASGISGLQERQAA